MLAHRTEHDVHAAHAIRQRCLIIQLLRACHECDVFTNLQTRVTFSTLGSYDPVRGMRKETFLIDCKLFPKEESLTETEYNLDTGLAALGSAL